MASILNLSQGIFNVNDAIRDDVRNLIMIKGITKKDISVFLELLLLNLNKIDDKTKQIHVEANKIGIDNAMKLLEKEFPDFVFKDKNEQTDGTVNECYNTFTEII